MISLTGNGPATKTLERLLALASGETLLHSRRVARICQVMGNALNLEEKETGQLILAASLHDIGKVLVPAQILEKPGSLSAGEMELVRTHSQLGAELAGASSELSCIVDSIRHHHEHWDGTGYPLGLAGEAIPFHARIIHVADAYDAMTHHRAYRRGICHSDALAELWRCTGTHFDPVLTACFSSLFSPITPGSGPGAV